MTEPEPFQTTRYRCTWCRRSWAAKRTCTEHIARCWFNPANRSCKTCEHFEPAYHGDPFTEGSTPEKCHAGVDLMRDVELGTLYDRPLLPLHCPKWERKEQAA